MTIVDVHPLSSRFHERERLRPQEAWLAAVEREGGLSFRLLGSGDRPEHPLSLVWVRTGGTEGTFRELLPRLCDPVFLLTNPGENSLAAALEILALIRSLGRRGEILHGTPGRLGRELAKLARCAGARARIAGARFGVFGEPSDWLVASGVDDAAVRERWGVEIVRHDLAPVLAACQPGAADGGDVPAVFGGLDPAVARLYRFLLGSARREGLDGLTLRCFDLLQPLRQTGCVPLAVLNDEGVCAACEGDVPALFTMFLGASLGMGPGFMANPSGLDAETGEMVLAHCTVPLSMVSEPSFPTHFESGLGAAVRGRVPEGECTLARVGGRALDRYWFATGAVEENLARADLCRTQVRVRLRGDGVASLLADPLGNHRILFVGDHGETLRLFFRHFAGAVAEAGARPDPGIGLP